MEIPREKVKAVTKSPEVLVIYSKYKQGKSTALSLLDNNLILDFENGTNFLDALKIQIKEVGDIRKVGDAIIEAGRPYKYISIDTITALEDFGKQVALIMYKATPIGKNYKEDDVLKLPNGAGYYWLRCAVESLIDYIKTLAPRLILSGHLKEKLITVDSKEVQASDLDMVGKLKNIICAKADAIGMLRREGNKTIISFQTSDLVSCGARPEHLRNKEIVLLESDETGKIIKNGWNEIFID